MARLPDWPTRLAALLAAAETRPFDAHRWNCGRFALAAVTAATGRRPAWRSLPSLEATADARASRASRRPSRGQGMLPWRATRPPRRGGRWWPRRLRRTARPDPHLPDRLHHCLAYRLILGRTAPDACRCPPHCRRRCRRGFRRGRRRDHRRRGRRRCHLHRLRHRPVGLSAKAEKAGEPRPAGGGDRRFDAGQPGAGRTQAFRQPVTEHQIVLGRCKVSGPIVFLHSATDDEGRADEYFYSVVVLAAHRVRAIGEVFLGDKVETDGSFSGLVRIDRHLGVPSDN